MSPRLRPAHLKEDQDCQRRAEKEKKKSVLSGNARSMDGIVVVGVGTLVVALTGCSGAERNVRNSKKRRMW